MIRWWRSSRDADRGFIFGTAFDEDVPGVVNAVEITATEATNNLGESWVRDKSDILTEWGIDPLRLQTSFSSPEALDRFATRVRVYTAQRNADRFLRNNGEINLEEQEAVPEKKDKWRPLNPDLIPPLDADEPPFKMPYQALEEVQLRLNQSVILVKSQPFYVNSVEPEKGDFMLHLSDAKKGQFKLPYSCPDLSLRSPPPGYVVSQDGVVSYFVRVPERVQKQGCAPENTKRKKIGESTWGSFSGAGDILNSLSGRKPRVYTRAIHAHMQDGLIKAAFLTKNVALFAKDEDVLCEYKGRKLGYVRDGYVALPGSDRGMSFIVRDLRQANLEV